MTKEVFLYICEDCGTCIFNEDCGKASYNNYCAGCKQGSFFKKVVIRPAYDMFGIFQGNRFCVEGREDDSKKEE